jgi:hypothetical protein
MQKQHLLWKIATSKENTLIEYIFRDFTANFPSYFFWLSKIKVICKQLIFMYIKRAIPTVKSNYWDSITIFYIK